MFSWRQEKLGVLVNGWGLLYKKSSIEASAMDAQWLYVREYNSSSTLLRRMRATKSWRLYVLTGWHFTQAIDEHFFDLS